jgi:hypothetical protein
MILTMIYQTIVNLKFFPLNSQTVRNFIKPEKIELIFLHLIIWSVEFKSFIYYEKKIFDFDKRNYSNLFIFEYSNNFTNDFVRIIL